MAKKALKRASWRTLARRAEKAAPPVARRLRKEAAAKRRIERAAKKSPAATRAARGWETRRRKKAVLTQYGDALLNGNKAQEGENQPSTLGGQGQTAWQVRSMPGHGEIVGGQLARLAEKLAHLARTKGGKDTIQHELMAFQMQAKHDGSAETDKNATKQLLDVQQRFDERVVCGFLAEVDHAEQHYRGLPPQMVWTFSSHTVVKIVDALNKAGYRSTGKT